MRAPAIKTFQLTVWVPDKLLRATVTGCFVGSEIVITPKRKSFQIFVNWKMPATTNPGIDNGTMTAKNVLRIPAPSIAAASTISFGMLT